MSKLLLLCCATRWSEVLCLVMTIATRMGSTLYVLEHNSKYIYLQTGRPHGRRGCRRFTEAWNLAVSRIVAALQLCRAG